ncbi:MAG: hypothetical protein HYY34_03550 [Chloroflexi bacterium]|nr:hypothetical protein [Chloroflexota bacterium]
MDTPAPAAATAATSDPGVVPTLAGSDGHRLLLHEDRVEVVGGEGATAVWGSIPLGAVTGVGIDQRPKDRGLLVWGVLGLLAAFGIWQVASNDNVRTLGAFAVAAISGVLLIQYYFRPPGLQLLIQAGVTAKGIPIRTADIPAAKEFALSVLRSRDRLSAGSESSGWRRVPRYPIA